MSLKEWKKKYYPVTASAFAKKNKNNLVALVDHAIQKWSGLSPEILDEYSLRRASYDSHLLWDDLSGELSISITTASCSLCQVFIEKNLRCEGCPLYESRGQVQCDKATDKEDETPFGDWLENLNTEPMLKALKKARKWAEKQGV